MLYKVVKPFGPEAGPAWDEYRNWTHQKAMKSFDSVDSILREDCFEPQTTNDWKNCVNEDCKTHLLTNIEYAKAVSTAHRNSVVVGVDPDVGPEYRATERLRGYDILDEWCSVSLITNWGSDGDVFETVKFEANGLIEELSEALRTRDMLRREYPKDSHAEKCQVWAVYQVEP